MSEVNLKDNSIGPCGMNFFKHMLKENKRLTELVRKFPTTYNDPGFVTLSTRISFVFKSKMFLVILNTISKIPRLNVKVYNHVKVCTRFIILHLSDSGDNI